MLRLILAGIIVCHVHSFACSNPSIINQIDANKQENDPTEVTIPFHLLGNTIFFETTIGDQHGMLLLDSGSPSLIINKKYFKDQRVDDSDYYSSDVTGSTTNLQKTVISLELLNRKNHEAFIMDLTGIERTKDIKLLGIAGYNIFDRYEMVLDYQEKEITLYELNGKGNRKSETAIHQTPDYNFKMKRSKHLLYLEAELGSNKLKLGVDCGAELTTFEISSLEHLNDHYTHRKTVALVATTGHRRVADVVALDGLQIEETELSVDEVILTSLSEINRHLTIRLDGVLGHDFLFDYKVSLNYKKKTISLWMVDQQDIAESKNR